LQAGWPRLPIVSFSSTIQEAPRRTSSPIGGIRGRIVLVNVRREEVGNRIESDVDAVGAAAAGDSAETKEGGAASADDRAALEGLIRVRTAQIRGAQPADLRTPYVVGPKLERAEHPRAVREAPRDVAAPADLRPVRKDSPPDAVRDRLDRTDEVVVVRTERHARPGIPHDLARGLLVAAAMDWNAPSSRRSKDGTFALPGSDRLRLARQRRALRRIIVVLFLTRASIILFVVIFVVVVFVVVFDFGFKVVDVSGAFHRGSDKFFILSFFFFVFGLTLGIVAALSGAFHGCDTVSAWIGWYDGSHHRGRHPHSVTHSSFRFLELSAAQCESCSQLPSEYEHLHREVCSSRQRGWRGASLGPEGCHAIRACDREKCLSRT
jgi:hypothetical protein